MKSLSTGTWLSLAVIAAYFALVLSAPWIAPFGEAQLIGQAWSPSSAKSWLGTDSLGRDILSRMLFGGRTTITVAFAITLVAFAVGVSLGFLAAIMRGWVDMALSRIVDAVMALPNLIMALVILTVLGSSIPVLIGTLALLDATRIFRLSRSIALDIMAMDFIEVARLRGEGVGWIMRREILPNATQILVAEFALRFGFAVLKLSALSFLGLGVQPPNADWGSMVQENAMAINFGLLAPIFPATAIAGLSIALNIFVDGLSTGSSRRPHVQEK